MYIIKRDGRRESVRLDKIQSRIEKMAYGLDLYFIKPLDIAVKVINGLYDGVTSTELDNLAAETAAAMSTQHPDYSLLAARLAVSNLHKSTNKSFSSVTKILYTNTSERTGDKAPLVSAEYYKVVREHAALLDEAILHNRDFEYKYFGYKTLEKSYLMKVHGRIVERPQHCLMRIAVGIHGNDIPAALETYELMSNRLFTHATPTMFNAGTPKPQLSSCFLLTMKEDSIDGIYDTLKQCAKISQSAGGIGLSIHNVRAKGSYIKGTGGESNGIVPMLRNFDMTARYVDQGGGKRKGSFAIYLEPWHADIYDLLELKKNHGKEEMRARDLFYALWIPDLFMQRTQNDEMWSLMCPNECPGLSEVYGDEFEKLYTFYEKQGRFRKQIKAQDLWSEIVNAQIETGSPYMLYKDAANKKSNQKNLGTIKSSNLCTEILEYTAPDEVAVCNLASISLPAFVEIDDDENRNFNHHRLYQIVKVITRNLNKIIDINYYPVEEAKKSNTRHRPIGIGVQGLADTFIQLRLPFASSEAKILNEDIFETIYYAAMETSMELAKEFGPYETFAGSPLSKGIFQFDMWSVKPKSGRYNWDALKKNVVEFGARNSLLVAPMPTASTSQILGNNECFEPISSNLYTRRTLSGDFIVANHYLMNDLIKRGLWSESMRQKIIAHKGSVQNIPEIPADLKELYKTVWEISQKVIIEMSADRGAYICQSQSLNLHLSNANAGKITSMHFHAWKAGLKTGMYYLRTESAADAIQFTVDKEIKSTVSQNSEMTLFTKEFTTAQAVACSLENPEACEACGS